MESDLEHQPVLLEEAVNALNIRADGVYVDATFGRGGHSKAILDCLNDSGRLLAFDQDPQAVAYGRQHFNKDKRIEVVHCNFRQVANMVTERGLDKKIDGVLMDLGVSSPQLDDAARGFSFTRSGPLDMRMNTEQGETAAQWLMRAEQKEIADVLWQYGEERHSRRIARAIVEYRQQAVILSLINI